MKHCKVCNVELVVGVNANQSMLNNSDYICKEHHYERARKQKSNFIPKEEIRQFKDTLYYVSKTGNVYRYYPERQRSTSSYKGKIYHTTYPEHYRLIKPSKRIDGYYSFMFKDKKNYRRNRLVAECWVDGKFDDAVVDHIDNDKTNDHYTNLQWCTIDYNTSKADKKNYPLYLDTLK